MLSINYDGENLVLTETQDPVFKRFSYAWTREEFEAMAGVDVGQYAKVIYEPGKPMFLVTTAADPYTVLTYHDPADHPALNWIQNHELDILQQARTAHAAVAGYVWDGNTWVPEEVVLALQALKDKRLEQANLVAFGAFQIVSTLGDVGSRAGLDIITQVNARLATIKSWLLNQRTAIAALSTAEEARAYTVDAPEETILDDIQWVMNQVT